MHTTIHQFKRLAADDNGNLMPMGDGLNGSQRLTAVGNANAITEPTRFVRIATDTAITVNVYGGTAPVLLPAGAVEFFPVVKDQVLAVAAA
jgi:hypothetical protein